jgi:phosphoribosyl-dephospho-CoA transferase
MPVCAPPPFHLDAASTAPSGDTHWQPHDLLRLRRLRHDDSEPPWVRDAFARAPFAVVRRAQAAAGFIAIGLRGDTRQQRYGAWAEADDVEAAATPEELVDIDPSGERRALPAFVALAALRSHATTLAAFRWGPTGSVGFELATGFPAVTSSSDLDLLIRAPARLTHEAAVAMLSELQAHARREGIRIDAQVETPAGGIALAELAAGKPRVMARHSQGPVLVADPWSTTGGGD